MARTKIDSHTKLAVRQDYHPDTVAFIASLGIRMGRMPTESEVLLYVSATENKREQIISDAIRRTSQREAS